MKYEMRNKILMELGVCQEQEASCVRSVVDVLLNAKYFQSEHSYNLVTLQRRIFNNYFSVEELEEAMNLLEENGYITSNTVFLDEEECFHFLVEEEITNYAETGRLFHPMTGEDIEPDPGSVYKEYSSSRKLLEIKKSIKGVAPIESQALVRKFAIKFWEDGLEGQIATYLIDNLKNNILNRENYFETNMTDLFHGLNIDVPVAEDLIKIIRNTSYLLFYKGYKVHFKYDLYAPGIPKPMLSITIYLMEEK
jgi:hypothetical protein